MSFFKSLFSKNKPDKVTVVEEQMEGEEYQVADIEIYHSKEFELQENPPWTLHIQQKFLEKFSEMSFVFDGKFNLFFLYHFGVDRNLIGETYSFLYSHTMDELTEHYENWKEMPNPIGIVIFQYWGKPVIKVKKYSNYPDVMASWNSEKRN